MSGLAFLVAFLLIGGCLVAVVPPQGDPDQAGITFAVLVGVTALAARGVVA